MLPTPVTDAQLRQFCAVREAWAEKARYPVAWVVDLRGIMSATALQRRIFSEHLERFEHHDIAYNRGSALIVPNAMIRGIVTAVFWLKKPRFPNECFPTREEAVTWALERLGFRGARRPSGPAPRG